LATKIQIDEFEVFIEARYISNYALKTQNNVQIILQYHRPKFLKPFFATKILEQFLCT
jgi:hypothetical protein